MCLSKLRILLEGESLSQENSPYSGLTKKVVHLKIVVGKCQNLRCIVQLQNDGVQFVFRKISFLTQVYIILLQSKAELACKRVQECHLLKSRISDLCCSSSKEAYKEHDCFPTNSISLTQVRHLKHVAEKCYVELTQSFCALTGFLYS